MFKDAGTMWLSVRKQRCFQLQRGHPMADWGDLTGLRDEHPHLHAAGAQCQGSEKSPCSRPASKQSRGRRMLRFSCLPVELGNQRCPTHAGPSCVPGPPLRATSPVATRVEGDMHPRQRKLA